MRLSRKAFRAVALAAVMVYAVLLGAVPAGASTKRSLKGAEDVRSSIFAIASSTG